MNYRAALYVLLTMVSVLRPETGKSFSRPPELQWKMQLGPVFGSPVISGQTVFIASTDSALHAVNLETGAERWQFKFNGASRSTPFPEDDKIYILSEDAALYCLDQATGELHWRFLSPQGTLGERRYDRADYFQSAPVSDTERVYFGMGDQLYAVNTADGTQAWTFSTGNLVHTRPALAGDNVIFGSYDGHVYALNRELGVPVWKFKTAGHRYFPKGEVMGSPAVSMGRVFVGSRDYNLYALDAYSGTALWNRQFPKGWALANTVHRDSVLYVGTSDDYLMLALDPDSGAEYWRTSLKYNIFAPMAIGGDVGYAATLMGRLFALDLKTGDILWSLEGDGYREHGEKYFDAAEKHHPYLYARFANFDEVLKMYGELGAVFASPVLSGNTLVWAGADGWVYCYRVNAADR